VREVADDFALLVEKAHNFEPDARPRKKARIVIEGTVEVELCGCEGLNREEAILQDREAREEIGDLIGPGESERGAPMRGEARDVSTEEPDPAFGRTGLSADQAEEGGFPRSVWADESATLTGRDREAYAINRAEPSKRFGDVREAQRQGGRFSHVFSAISHQLSAISSRTREKLTAES